MRQQRYPVRESFTIELVDQFGESTSIPWADDYPTVDDVKAAAIAWLRADDWSAMPDTTHVDVDWKICNSIGMELDSGRFYELEIWD